ncbi:MAG TPA: glutaredoxin family protein [Deinococcales bacterium]|nr:glutaredoxin family protein [Deinococcales bacterium]
MIKMYTTSWCPDCTAAKRVLSARGIAFEEIDIERDETAAAFVMRVNGGRRSVPTLVLDDDAISLSQFSRSRLDGWLSRHGLLQPA